MQIIGNNSEYSTTGKISDSNGIELFNIGLKIEPINIIASIAADAISAQSTFSPSFQIENYSAANYSDIKIIVQSLSNGVEITENNGANFVHTIQPFSSGVYQTDYTLNVGDLASGSTMTLLLQLQNADSVFLVTMSSTLLVHFLKMSRCTVIMVIGPMMTQILTLS